MTATAPAIRARPAPTAAQARRRRLLVRVGLHLLLALGAVTMIVPFVWMLLTSVKSPAELASFPPTFWPDEWVWSNYSGAMQAAPFATYFRNSLIIATGHTLITLLFGSLAGYALARIPFRGRELLFLGFIAMLMIPTYTKIVPQFLIVRFMPLSGGNDLFGQGGSGWLNTWWALLIPGGLSPFAIFLFRQFYLSLPRELEEAARIDGLGELRIWAQIYTPLIKPAVATVALLTFQESWNNFLWPLLVTTRDELRVIQVGLAVFQQQENTAWHHLMAGTTLATVPMVLLFLLAQRYFIQGFTQAGIK
ncbi:MAG: ABC transporter permease subunit [Micromonosporaceae bacterium]|nr:ABC transporter permease subunit [Micromonosporaceae bacterium]